MDNKMYIKGLSIKKYLNYYSSLFLAVAAFLIGFRSTIGVSNIPDNKILTMITLILWGFILLSIVFNQYNRRELFVSLFLLLFAFAIYLHSKILLPFYNTIVVVAALHKNYKKILIGHFFGILLACILVLFFFVMGIIPDTIYYDGSKSLGFFNPNAFPIRFAYLVFLGTYIWYKKIRIPHLILFIFLSIWVYKQTGSRAELIIVTGFSISVILVKCSKLYRKLFLQYCVIAAIFIAMFSIFGIVLYSKSSLIQKIDTMLTGRLSQPLYYLGLYKPTILGNYMYEFQVPGARPKMYTIDNGYARIIIEWGILYFFIHFIAYWKTIKMCVYNKDYKVITVLLFVLLYMLSESVFCSLNINWLIIITTEAYFSRKICKMKRFLI